MHVLLTSKLYDELEMQDVQLLIVPLHVLHLGSQFVQVPLRGASVPPPGH
jgi:hypothetical protein